MATYREIWQHRFQLIKKTKYVVLVFNGNNYKMKLNKEI